MPAWLLSSRSPPPSGAGEKHAHVPIRDALRCNLSSKAMRLKRLPPPPRGIQGGLLTRGKA